MNTVIVIPARMQSTRLPNKPLKQKNGKSLIQHVWEQCKATGHDVYVATDHQDIVKDVESFKGKWIMTDPNIPTGTDRCAEILKHTDHSFIVNVQGDMPHVTPEMIDKTVMLLKEHPVSTLYTEMPEDKQNDPSTVKMIRYHDKALWFGRGMTGYGDWHLGIYGFSANVLSCYGNLDITQEERVEKLEQLRWLKNGWQIGCAEVSFNGLEINTAEDYEIWCSQ
jgi:3-deoxy-manno-octulosonate cytidylyltransferase (CMP-KDO synthetase)